MIKSSITQFFKLESAGGIVLLIMALIALISYNSPWQTVYDQFFNQSFTIYLKQWQFHSSLSLIINDGLMAIFFLLVGLEIKREILIGELNSLAKIALPGIAALGGMIVPALIYLMVNSNNAVALRGWAIPTATDIAFALGLMSLLGKRLPQPLRLFLLALAIFDDIGAIIIISIFYAGHISLMPLLISGICFAGLLLLNFFQIKYLVFYLLLGFLLWYCILLSGVHATIAGVLLALTIPLHINPYNSSSSPLQKLEKVLHPWVVFGILPLFALANAGVSLAGMQLSSLFNPISVGIALGLFLGKQLGVFTAVWLTIRCGWAKLPKHTNWTSIYGTALVCGMGFTMSLFMGNLAFSAIGYTAMASMRLGVLVGTFISGLAGYCLLRFTACKSA